MAPGHSSVHGCSPREATAVPAMNKFVNSKVARAALVSAPRCFTILDALVCEL